MLPVWLFAAYLFVAYALHEQSRIEQEALWIARQVSLVVDGEIVNLKTLLEGLSKAPALADDDLQAFGTEASRLVQGTDQVITLRDLGGRALASTESAKGSEPSAEPLTPEEREHLDLAGVLVSNVFAAPGSNAYRIAVTRQVSGSKGQALLLSMSVPTERIRLAMLPAVPAGWTVAVGDREGNYVARSKLHGEVTGKPGLPEYLAKVVGRSGTFRSRNFEGTTLLAGYYRSPYSDWFYTANVPLSDVQAPLWWSLAQIGATGLTALLVSLALGYVVGTRFTKATVDLAARADALGSGSEVEPLSTTVAEFDSVAQAMIKAGRAIAERTRELETVLDTAPVAVWFTYDPQARQVIRNRFAAELMGLSTESRRSFGTPDLVIDTLAYKNGQPVSREDRPLSRAMRGEETHSEEFAYTLPSGEQRYLLSSARPIRSAEGSIIGAVQISLDISERKRGEEQRQLLVKELNHRVKNTLAVVQAIAGQTIRTATSLAQAGAALSSRLISLAKAHDLLTRENWSGADLQILIAASIEPHAPLARFDLSGERVWLPPNIALSFALALHELTTNAIKYGALSNSTGSISISWKVEEGETSRVLELDWHEKGGPPVARGKRGFGTELLHRIFEYEGGGVTLNYEQSGLHCAFRVGLLPGRETLPTGTGALPADLPR
ncbi:HWE histidine kinase domain-containing protein [Mesorhizobium sp. M1A.F.Ca.ET.072.01.1.1]|uniref:sensor histidine kinase n=1 Tax=Mesorhizobium sp. M1A.F.Ca.ET.072.01.1.1 TaxID=2496753 RepID=UPI001FDED307|nr:HWE histidine kinase domain-containing protein [Mesorhizobium sp. M1A.F.Ca.ET.072.01.1.1]